MLRLLKQGPRRVVEVKGHATGAVLPLQPRHRQWVGARTGGAPTTCRKKPFAARRARQAGCGELRGYAATRGTTCWMRFKSTTGWWEGNHSTPVGNQQRLARLPCVCRGFVSRGSRLVPMCNEASVRQRWLQLQPPLQHITHGGGAAARRRGAVRKGE